MFGLWFALDQIRASIEEGRKAQEAVAIGARFYAESEEIKNYKMYHIERMRRDIKVIAHFDDGYYTINNEAWVKCDKEGKC